MEILQIYNKVVRVSLYIFSLAPVLLYFYGFKKHTKTVHIIGILSLVSAIANIVTFVAMQFYNFGSAVINNLYCVFQFCLLSSYFYETKFNDYSYKVFWIAAVNIALTALASTFYIQGIYQHQNFLWLTVNAVLIAYCFTYRNAGSQLEERHRIGLLWINRGILTNAILSIVPFSLTPDFYTTLNRPVAECIWRLNNLGNMYQSIAFAAGIYVSSIKKN
jgi:hypothetical protein